MSEKKDTQLIPTAKQETETEKREYYKKMMEDVYSALKEKGYNPVSQIVGYMFSDDPTYITAHNKARINVQKLDRYELLQFMLEEYLGIQEPHE